MGAVDLHQQNREPYDRIRSSFLNVLAGKQGRLQCRSFLATAWAKAIFKLE
jgi:hypothetical protein